MDPFDILGIEPSLDLDDKDLEGRYLTLSRECHPDFNQSADPAQTTAILQRAADLNRSYKLLRDRWQRAEAIVDRLDPEAMARTKTLDPAFLMEAMEWAEEVSDTTPPAPELERRLTAQVEAAFAQVREAVQQNDAVAAARALHESRYSRKALSDLRAKS